MKESDQLATSFITPIGAYYYVTMPFGLKKHGATYQGSMKHYLHEQIDKNVEAYFNDIIVSSSKARNLIQDLSKTFDNLQKFKIKLNQKSVPLGYHPANCSVISYWLAGLRPIPRRSKSSSIWDLLER